MSARDQVFFEYAPSVDFPERRARFARQLDQIVTEARTAIRGEHPADFFQPGRTYSIRIHDVTAEFRVEHIATHPDGHPVAFGWYRREPRTSWHPYTSSDFLAGWTDSGEASRG